MLKRDVGPDLSRYFPATLELVLTALLIGVALVFLSLFLFVPLVTVFFEAFKKGWDVYVAAITDPDAVSAIWLTLTAAVIAVFTLASGAIILIPTFLWSVGLIGQIVAILLLRNGLGAESLAWGIMFMLLPLTCVYYPVAVLPHWLQYFAWALPPTYVFEGMRSLVIDHVFRGDLMVQAFALNAGLLIVATTAFLLLLRSARREGTLLQGGD